MTLREENKRLRAALYRAGQLLVQQQELVAPLLGEEERRRLDGMRTQLGELKP